MSGNGQSPFTVKPLLYPDILVDDDLRSVERLLTEGGKGIFYCAQELSINTRLILRVDKINSSPIIHILNDEEIHCLKVGVTDCPPDSVNDYPYHFIDACKIDHDCGGSSITVPILEVQNEGDEIILEKTPEAIRVQVNGRTVFNLQDPHSVVYKTRDGKVYPFVMLSGSVEKVTLIPFPLHQEIRNNACRELGQCVICFEHEVDHMAIPCNHAAFCARDATSQMEKTGRDRVCPICRNPVTSFLRIFLS